MNSNTWEVLDKHFADVERTAGRRLTMASDMPSGEEISLAASEIKVKFGDDYVAFLRRYGGAVVGSLPVFGLRPVEALGDPWSVVAATQEFRRQGWPGTDGWYVISNDGFGNAIAIAREGRVMIADHDAGQIDALADSFEDFLVHHCLQTGDEPT